MFSFQLNSDQVNQASPNFFIDNKLTDALNIDSLQNKSVFSEKWEQVVESSNSDNDEYWKSFQFEWFYKLYGFESEEKLIDYLSNFSSIPFFVDAGCGKGYKTAWLSRLNKQAQVLGVDFSTSAHFAAKRYFEDYKSVSFLQANIAAIPMQDESCDLVLCDQVLHHTEDPQKTLNEFWRILKPGGKLLTYVYRKKALPRELLDEHFRTAVHSFSDEELWDVARGMTQLGKLLSDNDICLDFPDIKPLGIKGGKQSLQRFLYWNFFKCFWNDDFGYDDSLTCNFDWYSPSIAFRYNLSEFNTIISNAGFCQEFLHEEEACISGRFVKAAL